MGGETQRSKRGGAPGTRAALLPGPEVPRADQSAPARADPSERADAAPLSPGVDPQPDFAGRRSGPVRRSTPSLSGSYPAAGIAEPGFSAGPDSGLGKDAGATVPLPRSLTAQTSS